MKSLNGWLLRALRVFLLSCSSSICFAADGHVSDASLVQEAESYSATDDLSCEARLALVEVVSQVNQVQDLGPEARVKMLEEALNKLKTSNPLVHAEVIKHLNSAAKETSLSIEEARKRYSELADLSNDYLESIASFKNEITNLGNTNPIIIGIGKTPGLAWVATRGEAPLGGYGTEDVRAVQAAQNFAAHKDRLLKQAEVVMSDDVEGFNKFKAQLENDTESLRQMTSTSQQEVMRKVARMQLAAQTTLCASLIVATGGMGGALLVSGGAMATASGGITCTGDMLRKASEAYFDSSNESFSNRLLDEQIRSTQGQITGVDGVLLSMVAGGGIGKLASLAMRSGNVFLQGGTLAAGGVALTVGAGDMIERGSQASEFEEYALKLRAEGFEKEAICLENAASKVRAGMLINAGEFASGLMLGSAGLKNFNISKWTFGKSKRPVAIGSGKPGDPIRAYPENELIRVTQYYDPAYGPPSRSIISTANNALQRAEQSTMGGGPASFVIPKAQSDIRFSDKLASGMVGRKNYTHAVEFWVHPSELHAVGAGKQLLGPYQKLIRPIELGSREAVYVGN